MVKKLWCVCIIATALSLGATLATAKDFADISISAGVADDGLGKGVAFADINNDGLVDFYVANKGGANKLFLNKGNGRFDDITARAGKGIDQPGFSMGSVFGDYDNDGYADLYVANGGQHEAEANRLFRNNGDNTFTDVSEKAGVGLKAFTSSAAFVDYDNDGWLDIYCTNYDADKKNILYRNNGNGTFNDVTDTAGVGDRSASWMGVWADVNNDSFPDLYVVNGSYPRGEPNRLYLNNKNGTFTEMAKQAGVDDPNWGLGAAFADIDNDGDLDLFVSNYVGSHNLYLNNGKGSFSKSTSQIRGGHDNWGKGPTFGDIDHDGDLDLYEGDCKLANQLYLNDGRGNFANQADKQPVLECGTIRTTATSLADIDNDGDLDLYVVNWGMPNKLFKNTQDDKNWLKVKLTGTVSNHDAYGSKIKIFENSKNKLLALRETRSSTGFSAQEPKVAHFGLDATKKYDVVAVFPSGIEAKISGVKTGQTIEIIEPALQRPNMLTKFVE
jgi:hypothetical protein